MLPSARRRSPTAVVAWVASVLAILGLLAICVAAVLPSTVTAEKFNPRLEEMQEAPYARVPASAESVNERIVFGDLPDDVERFDTDHDVFFVTVTAPRQSLLSYWAGRGEPSYEPLTDEERNGLQTPSQRRAVSLQQMSTASQRAQYVALRALGFDAEINPGEVVVQEVLCRDVGDDGLCAEFYPSDEQIDPGDTIVEADGVELDTVEDLAAVLAAKKPGDTADLVIDRPEVGILEVTVELAEAPDEPDRTIVGFRPFDTSVVSLPFEVGFDTGQIGGPSAGLAFTLALIDELSPGDLTGDRNVAVTGTIGLDGTVGPIGGLTQKVNAVLQHDVDVVLVPASQRELREPEDGEPDLRQRLDDAGRGDVEIVPVATLDDALAALVRLGGDPLVRIDS